MSSRTTEVWKVEHDFQEEELMKFLFLYEDWIYPNKYEDSRDKEVLDAGSGPGIQARLYATYAKKVYTVDLEALDTTRAKTQNVKDKIEYLNGDIMNMDLGKQFDIVNCIGVIHHTDDPSKTFHNLKKHLKVGGRMIIWAYAKEGNLLMRMIVEPFRKLFLERSSHTAIWILSNILNAILYIPIWTIYRLPLTILPYYEYFENSRKMSFKRNSLNIYDKLNAPQQHFISKETIQSWFDSEEFKDVHISQYKGVSWRASGTRK